MSIINDIDGKHEVIKESGCTVKILLEPSAEWLAKRPIEIKRKFIDMEKIVSKLIAKGVILDRAEIESEK